MTRIAVVGNPGGWSSEHLADVVGKLTGTRCLIDPALLVLSSEDAAVRAGDHDLRAFDALILKKIGIGYAAHYLDRLETLRYLHTLGVPVFSDPARILRVLDRLACTVTLRAHGIPMPPTCVTEHPDAAVRAVRRFGRAVLKPLFSSKGRGMLVVSADDHPEEGVARFRAAGNPVLYVQQVVDLPGRDLGLVFLDGEYQGTYARRAALPIGDGGRVPSPAYEPYEPTPAIIALARRAQEPFGLAFTCVDVVETAAGPQVFEVSAFGGFRGLHEACGIDAAERFARFVLQRVRG